jgi:hypothetical protein
VLKAVTNRTIELVHPANGKTENHQREDLKPLFVAPKQRKSTPAYQVTSAGEQPKSHYSIGKTRPIHMQEKLLGACHLSNGLDFIKVLYCSCFSCLSNADKGGLYMMHDTSTWRFKTSAKSEA